MSMSTSPEREQSQNSDNISTKIKGNLSLTVFKLIIVHSLSMTCIIGSFALIFLSGNTSVNTASFSLISGIIGLYASSIVKHRKS